MPEFQLPSVNVPVVYPLISLTIVALAMVLVDAFSRQPRRGTFAAMSVIGLAMAGIFTIGITRLTGIPLSLKPLPAFGDMLIFDRMTIIVTLIIFASAIFTVLLSYDYLRSLDIPESEYFTILTFAALSMALLCASNELITLFISLEMLSLCLYVLVGINRRSSISQEGALKYFILGSVASAFMLMGIAYLWGVTGTTDLRMIRVELISPAGVSADSWMALAMALIIIGFAFKLALVPFHQWVPEAYVGAPTPITAFLATASKAAGFVALFHILQGISTWRYAVDYGLTLLFTLAILTMVTGNLLAIVQTNIKRMLAYSSVAHSGYMLVGVVVYLSALDTNPELADLARDAVIFYLFAYTLLNIIAFGVASALAPQGDSKIANLAGLWKRNGWLAVALSIAMFGLTGIPYTVGFLGKFMIFRTAIDAGFVMLSIVAMMASVVSAFYYLRVVVVMTMKESSEEVGSIPAIYSWASKFVIICVTIAAAVFFFFPDAVTRLFT